MSQEHQAVERDGLLDLYMEIPKERERLRKIAEPSPKKVLQEVEGTLGSLLQDTVAVILQFREWVGQSLGHVDGRLNDLESEQGDEAALSEEEAEKILRLAGEAQALAEHALENSPDIKPEPKARFDSLLKLCAEVIEIVALNVEGEEGEEGEEGAEEGAEEATDGATAEASEE